MFQDIFSQYLSWHFLEAPKNIFAAWKNFLKFGLNYFSVSLLIRTLFFPWHKYAWAYPRGFDAGKYLEIFISNLSLKIIGAIIRIFIIITGVLAEIFIIFAGIIVFLGWLLLPAFLIAGLVFGIKIIF